jgi:hypothetical protein
MARNTAVRISIDPASIARVKETLRRKPELLAKQVAGALNDTAKHEKSNISKLIREKVNIQKRDVDKYIGISRASPKYLIAEVYLEKHERIALKYFGARQTKKGVTYRIAKSSTPAGKGGRRKAGPKERITDAFGPNIPRLGGNVYRRLRGKPGDKYKSRNKSQGKRSDNLPIVKLFGPSAWGVFIRHEMRKEVNKSARAYLANRIKHRVQYQVK